MAQKVVVLAIGVAERNGAYKLIERGSPFRAHMLQTVARPCECRTVAFPVPCDCFAVGGIIPSPFMGSRMATQSHRFGILHL